MATKKLTPEHKSVCVLSDGIINHIKNTGSDRNADIIQQHHTSEPDQGQDSLIFVDSETVLKRTNQHEPTFDELMRCIREELDFYRASKPDGSNAAGPGPATGDVTQDSAQ